MWKRISDFKGKINCVNKGNNIQTNKMGKWNFCKLQLLQYRFSSFYFISKGVFWGHRDSFVGLIELWGNIRKYSLESGGTRHTPTTLLSTEMLNEMHSNRKHEYRINLRGEEEISQVFRPQRNSSRNSELKLKPVAECWRPRGGKYGTSLWGCLLRGKKNPTKDVKKYKVLEGTSHPEKSMQIANECINSPRISNN